MDNEAFNQLMKNAYYQGKVAATAGQPESVNPFTAGLPAHKNWLLGYKSALPAKSSTPI